MFYCVRPSARKNGWTQESPMSERLGASQCGSIRPRAERPHLVYQVVLLYEVSWDHMNLENQSTHIGPFDHIWSVRRMKVISSWPTHCKIISVGHCSVEWIERGIFHSSGNRYHLQCTVHVLYSGDSATPHGQADIPNEEAPPLPPSSPSV